MSERLKIFSASENCLTEDQLLLYMQHKLSPFEQHHVEKHLLDCELCSDALEGLRMASIENLSETFSELNQQIDKHVKQEEKKIIPLYPWLRIAAVIILIAVSAGTFFYLQKEQKQQEKIVAEKKPDLPPATQNNFELKSAEPVSTEPSKDIATKVAKEVPTPIANAQKNIDKQSLADTIRLNDISTSAVAAVTEENENRETVPQSVVGQPMPKAVQESKSETLSENAGVMDKSTSGNTRSEADFAKKQKADYESQITNSAVIINNAKFQMQNNQYDSANFLLDEVINNNDSKFMEEALWNKSIALENLNKKTDAKNILQRIVNMNGKYKKKATEKLKGW